MNINKKMWLALLGMALLAVLFIVVQLYVSVIPAYIAAMFAITLLSVILRQLFP